MAVKPGSAPGNALLFLQRRHSGGHAGVGPSPQSVCYNGTRQLHEQVFKVDMEFYTQLFFSILPNELFFPLPFLMLSGVAQVIRTLRR